MLLLRKWKWLSNFHVHGIIHWKSPSEQKIKPIRIETDGTKKHKKKLNTTQNSTDRHQKTNKQQIWRIALSLAHRRGNFSLFVSYISSIVVYQKHIYVRVCIIFFLYKYMYTNAFERLVAAMGCFVCRCAIELQLHRVHNENFELCIAICQCILALKYSAVNIVRLWLNWATCEQHLLSYRYPRPHSETKNVQFNGNREKLLVLWIKNHSRSIKNNYSSIFQQEFQ